MKRIMHSDQPSGEYSTDHLYLAAFLICQGHPLAGTDQESSGRVRFLFENSQELRSDAANFLAGGQVDARQFSFTLLRLKKCFPRKEWRNLNNGTRQESIRR